MLDSRTPCSNNDLAAWPLEVGSSRSPKQLAEALTALAPLVSPGHTYDVGSDCPRDDLYYRGRYA